MTRPPGPDIPRARFEALVAGAVARLPAVFRREIRNVAVVVEDEPDDELLDEMEVEPGDTLYGLYQGTPLPERQWAHGNVLPDRVVLFYRPIVEDAEDEEDALIIIAETVIHEFGHYFGLSEDEIEAIEEEYWRADDP
ncbi:MAG: metallopeptidase family protein [Vicinamibacterales bacterium]